MATDHASLDVASSRAVEVEVLEALEVDLARRQLFLRAALGEIMLHPSETAGGALDQCDRRAALMRDLDELAVADARLETALQRTCLAFYSRAYTARAMRPLDVAAFCALGGGR